MLYLDAVPIQPTQIHSKPHHTHEDHKDQSQQRQDRTSFVAGADVPTRVVEGRRRVGQRTTATRWPAASTGTACLVASAHIYL